MRRRAIPGLLMVFLEALAAAAAEYLLAAIGWLFRKWRKRRRARDDSKEEVDE